MSRALSSSGKSRSRAGRTRNDLADHAIVPCRCLTARQWRQRAGRVRPGRSVGRPRQLARFAFLRLFQRAVKLDQRARRWADSLLDVLVPSSRLARPVPPRQLDFRSRIHLLRASPLPSFLRSVTDLFNLSSKPEHWRPTLSKHDLANAVFALDEQALQGAVGQEPRGGSSAVMRERERRKVGEKGRRWVEQRLGEMERERAGAAGHDEL